MILLSGDMTEEVKKKVEELTFKPVAEIPKVKKSTPYTRVLKKMKSQGAGTYEIDIPEGANARAIAFALGRTLKRENISAKARCIAGKVYVEIFPEEGA